MLHLQAVTRTGSYRKSLSIFSPGPMAASISGVEDGLSPRAVLIQLLLGNSSARARSQVGSSGDNSVGSLASNKS